MAVTVVQHFDDALRRTPYDAFVERIRARADAHRLPDDPGRGVRLRATRDAGHARRARRTGRLRGGRRAAVHDRRARGPQLRDPRPRSPRATSTAQHGCSDGRSRSRARSAIRSMEVPGSTSACPSPCHPMANTPCGWAARRVPCGSGTATPTCSGRSPKVASRSSSERPDRRRSAAAEDLGCRVRVRRISASLADAVVRLPGRFAGLVVSLASRLTTLMP